MIYVIIYFMIGIVAAQFSYLGIKIDGQTRLDFSLFMIVAWPVAVVVFLIVLPREIIKHRRK